MRIIHVLAHLLDEGQKYDGRNGMADKRCRHQHDRREDKGHPVQTEAADAFR